MKLYRVPPWVWNRKNEGIDGRYRYHRNPHPLGVGLETMLNFDYMHKLLHPNQTRHIGDPNSNVQPNRIGMQHVVVRSVNIRRLTLDTSTIHMVNQNNAINQKTHPQNRPKAVKTPPMRPQQNNQSSLTNRRPISRSKGPKSQQRQSLPPRGPPRAPKSQPPQRKTISHLPQQRKPSRPPPMPPKPSNNNNKSGKQQDK